MNGAARVLSSRPMPPAVPPSVLRLATAPLRADVVRVVDAGAWAAPRASRHPDGEGGSLRAEPLTGGRDDGRLLPVTTS